MTAHPAPASDVAARGDATSALATILLDARARRERRRSTRATAFASRAWVALFAVLACASVASGCAAGEVGGGDASVQRDGASDAHPDAPAPPTDALVYDDTVASIDDGLPPIQLAGCDPLPGATRIELMPEMPVAPAPFNVAVHMPDAWVYVDLLFTGPSGTQRGEQHGVEHVGEEYIWHYSVPTSAPGDFCLTFTTDEGAIVRQRLAVRITGTGVIPVLDAGAADPPASCACRAGVDNFCLYPPGTAGCPMTAPRGYCDPNGDGSFSDGDWTRGYNEFHARCGAVAPPPDATAPPTSGTGLSCANPQWWNSPTATPYRDYNPTLGHAYWWDTDIAMSSHTPVQLRHDSRLIQQAVHAWGWQPTFADLVTGETFQFLHLQPHPADMHTTVAGMVYPAGTVVGLSGGDTAETGLGTYSTGAHLCVQTLNDYRTAFPVGRDACH